MHVLYISRSSWGAGRHSIGTRASFALFEVDVVISSRKQNTEGRERITYPNQQYTRMHSVTIGQSATSATKNVKNDTKPRTYSTSYTELAIFVQLWRWYFRIATVLYYG
uniref:AlNc14C146G7383 protein n=1 Tax=Albugo laibachii Nc14 TaxID=890382 RepID=F0WLJ5_9STRA|nr:AlNc14C146G7383 [Albugo laibachii Nc14]CCA24237.1 AlNc14C228G9257 [Albugo laibachii Nc14]|eukprot:CCA24237.1 AlNc14C228G9257 [Albugo laibachii Nc14]